MHRENGFTLIEMMTTLAIAAILMSLAIPALQFFTSNATQTGAINDFVSTVHLARNTAITTNARVTVCASTAGENCESVAWDNGWIVFADNNSNQLVDGDETIIATSAAVDGLTIQSGDFSRFLMYRPNGRIMNNSIDGNAGEFTVCDYRGTGHAKVVIVDLSGRPRLSETDASGAAPSCS
jgi:type IV fimbrial biogenesis protein FimT